MKIASLLLLVLAGFSCTANAFNLSYCFTAFELSRECIAYRGLEHRVELFNLYIKGALRAQESSFKISLRVVNGETPPVLTMTEQGEFMLFMSAQSLFWQDSALENVATYVVTNIINIVSHDNKVDIADIAAAAYFRMVADGNEHLLLWRDGVLHEISYAGTPGVVYSDMTKYLPLVTSGHTPVIMIHNHTIPNWGIAMMPSPLDYGAAAALLFETWKHNPGVAIEYRVISERYPDQQVSMSFWLKDDLVSGIRDAAKEYRRIKALLVATPYGTMDFWYRLQYLNTFEKAQNVSFQELGLESFSNFMNFVSPGGILSEGFLSCQTRPERFFWPSDKFFMYFRGVVTPEHFATFLR